MNRTISLVLLVSTLWCSFQHWVPASVQRWKRIK